MRRHLHEHPSASSSILAVLLWLALPACGSDAPDPADVQAQHVAALDLDEEDTTAETPSDDSAQAPTPDDSDGDGIADADEQQGCTDPANPDSDGDGLPDGWELNGNGVFDYPGQGASPCHKDVFVEIDYEVRTGKGITQSARMGMVLEQQLIEYYAALPIENPDGQTGITLHLYASDVLAAGFDCASGTSQFSFDRAGFHKAMFCLSEHGGAKGVAAWPGQRLHITAPPVNQNAADDRTEYAQYTWYWMFLHELGHNLGLGHGGNVAVNRKPHYPSVMNYWYDESLAGSPHTLDGAGVGYTTARPFLALLDECALDEKASFPGFSEADLAFLRHAPASFYTEPGDGAGAWVDWNRNGSIDGDLVKSDVNRDGHQTCGSAFADVNDIDVLRERMGRGLPARPRS